jgi:predicted RNase H-like HicB family nuclease
VSDYHINIFYSEEDRGYIGDIPDLDSCSAFGATPEQALLEVEKAKEAWLQAARAAGRPIPLPRYRPFIYQTGGQTDADLAPAIAREKPVSGD